MSIRNIAFVIAIHSLYMPGALADPPLALEGVVVTPHVLASNLKYLKPPKDDLSAKVDLIVHNLSDKPLVIRSASFGGRQPEELRLDGQWAWHSMKQLAGSSIPAGARMVWSYNARQKSWGIGSKLEANVDTDQGEVRLTTPIDAPAVWLSAVTFLGEEKSPYPSRYVVHVQNYGVGITLEEIEKMSNHLLHYSQATPRTLAPFLRISLLKFFCTLELDLSSDN